MHSGRGAALSRLSSSRPLAEMIEKQTVFEINSEMFRNKNKKASYFEGGWNPVFHRSLRQSIVEAIMFTKLLKPVKPLLTPTERSVLDLIGQGKTSKEIAAALSMSILTVGNHRKSISRKLNLHSTAELAAHGAMSRTNPPIDTPCTLTLTCKVDQFNIDVMYGGRLTLKGGSAKVSVGEFVFRF